MSWWNTSNFTDLASKALKTAQKKIDSALDINEDGTPKHAPTASTNTSGTSVQKESSGKSDFLGTWGGGSNTEDSSGAASGWSFPWGASTGEPGQESTSESLVKVKSAEEIKSEVLKAAKERTKAKAKLFPQKTKSVVEPTKTEQETVTAEIDVMTGSRVKLKGEKTHGTGSVDVVRDTITKSEEVSSSILKEIEPSEIEFSVQSPKKTEERKQSTVKDIQENIELEEEKEILAELNISESEEKNPMHSSFTIGSLSDSEKNEKEKTVTDLKETDEQPLSVYDKNEDNFQTSKTDDAHDVINVASNEVSDILKEEQTNERQPTHVEEKTVIPETEDTTESDAGFSVDSEKTGVEFSVEMNEANVSVETDLNREFSGTDISSSVEFVSEKDIPAVENMTVSETVDFCEQSSSDPEIVDCDKTNSDEEFVNDKVSDDLPYEMPQHESLSVIQDFSDDKRNETEVTVTEISQEVTEVGGDINQEIDGNEVVVETEEKTKEDTQFELGAKVGEHVNVVCEESLLMVVQDSVQVQSFKSSDSESSVNKLDSSMDTFTSEDTVVEPGLNLDDSYDKSALSLKMPEDSVEQNVKSELSETNEDPDEEFTKDFSEKIDVKADTEDNDAEKDTISPAHSFVKCMLEDAIDEAKHGDDNSDSHSSIEKSEGTRSIYSNQESGDEIDTTTSSDIEIISLPTPNGENRQVSPLDPIPLRIALQKTSWRGSPTHRRTDSSDSSNASGGNYELSPGRDSTDYADYHRSHSEHMDSHTHSQVPELPALTEEDDNPYHPQRLLKKLAEMAEVLQAREEKLVTLSKENCDLMETNSILKSQLKQSEDTREAEMTDVNELTAEFTNRLTDAEKRVSSSIQEKEIIKKQLLDAQSELVKRAGDVSLKEVLAEKEEQIAELLQEGEKLSKSQLQSNTIIKKLRQKEKDNESTITSQKKKIDSQTTELEHLRKVLDSKEELEKKQTEAIAQLTSAVKKQEQEMVKLKSEHEDAVEKARGLQVALDNSYKEMAELHRNNAAQDSKAQEAALSAETHVREELKIALEKQQQQHKWAVESLNMQIEDHRLGMTRMEKEYNRREDLLKQEIGDLQKHLQEDELRNQELTQGVSLATRPLLRQIENLQSTYNAQSSTWEKVERNISERLADTQNQLAIATEKERTANEQVMELGSKVTSLETQTARLKQERSQMSAQLEMLKTKVELSEDAKQNEAAQIELMKHQMAQEMQELKKQKVLMETQLDVEKSKLEQERKKTSMLQEQLKDMERDLARSMSRSRGTPVRASPSPVSVSRQESMIGSIHENTFTAITQEELDRSFILSSPNGNKQSLYDALRQSGAANLLENLQSQLKLREGETSHLQREIKTLEQTRESMARELVDLSNKNDDLEIKVKDIPILETQLKELDQRYNALLQMYGEKSEQAEELKLDLQDIKDMYKAQINQLVGQS